MRVRKLLSVAVMAITVVAVAVSMTSCLDNVSSDYTPEIHISQLYVNPYYRNDTLVAEDTLNFVYNESLSMYVSDTLSLGDTATVGMIFYAVGNDLKSTQVAWDTTSVKAWLGLNDAVRSVLSDTTKVATGYLPINPGYNMVSYPVYFVPKKSGVQKITVTVESDSKYSPVSESFGLVIR